MKMRASLLVAACIPAVAVGVAGADTKSWTAIKGKLPTTTAVVLSMDVSAVRGTPVFAKAVETIEDVVHDVKEGVERVKSLCGIDITAAVSDVTLAMDAKGKHGVVALGLIGLDEPKVAACFTKMAKQEDAKNEITSKKVGALTKYFMKGKPEDKDPLFVAWLAKDVLAIGLEPGSSKDLEAAMAGGAAKGELGGYVGKVDTKAMAWGAGVVGEEHIKGGYGTATYAKAAVSVDAHMAMDAVDAATKLRDEAKKEIAGKADKAKKYPGVAAALKTVVIGGAGAEVVVDGSVKEADLASFLTDFDHVF